MVRIIHWIDPKDSYNEGIYITEDIDTDAGDFVPYGCTLYSDTQHDIDLPSGFPIEYGFKKEI